MTTLRSSSVNVEQNNFIKIFAHTSFAFKLARGNRKLKGFKLGEQIDGIMAEVRAHAKDVSSWREQESYFVVCFPLSLIHSLLHFLTILPRELFRGEYSRVRPQSDELESGVGPARGQGQLGGGQAVEVGSLQVRLKGKRILI